MAINFINSGTGSSTGSTISWTHNITDNSSALLLVAYGNRRGSINITSLKFAGLSLTNLILGSNLQNTSESELWYLVSPPLGLGTFNGTTSVSSAYELNTVSMNYTNVNPGTPFAGSASVLGTSVASGSITRTLGANNIWAGNIHIAATPGTTSTGNERGTIKANTNELLAADSSGGTLRWTFPSVSQAFVALAAELNAQVVNPNLTPQGGGAFIKPSI